MLTNIAVKHKEYRYEEGRWVCTQNLKYKVTSVQIENMLESQHYFTSMGGSMYWDYKQSRKFNRIVPSKVVSISFCGKIRKVLWFDYSQAIEEESSLKEIV
jgi:CTP:phosphocholine cytidylyltransferase-like protein